MTDAFAPAKSILTTEEAIATLVAAVTPVTGTETVPLFDSVGRVLAEDLVALRTVPAADNSAMDGYAVRTVDLGPARSVCRWADGSPPATAWTAPSVPARRCASSPGLRSPRASTR